MPLYLIMMVCREAGDMTGARSVASEIVGKQAKVNTPEVDRIRQTAMDLLGDVDDYGESLIHDTH